MKLIAKQISLITVIQADGHNHIQWWFLSLSQYTETFRGRKILNNIQTDFSKIPAETEQQQRVGVICQNSVALASALEDY